MVNRRYDVQIIMNNIPNQIIIIGGGTSINEGIQKGLWNKIHGQFNICINYAYRYLVAPVHCCCDQVFYQEENEKLKDLPLVLCKFHPFPSKYRLPNTLMFNTSADYDPTLQKGVYKSSLTGIFALTLAIYLLKHNGQEGVKEVFILGYDYGVLKPTMPKETVTEWGQYTGLPEEEKKVINLSVTPPQNAPVVARTHFYQGEVHHRGIGKKSYYSERERDKRDFGVFVEEEKDVKVWNVSMGSNISCFEKIGYEEFFGRIGETPTNCSQDEIKSFVIKELEQFKKE